MLHATRLILSTSGWCPYVIVTATDRSLCGLLPRLLLFLMPARGVRRAALRPHGLPKGRSLMVLQPSN